MSKEKFAEEMLLPRYEITFYPNVARNDLSFMHGSIRFNTDMTADIIINNWQVVTGDIVLY